MNSAVFCLFEVETRCLLQYRMTFAVQVTFSESTFEKSSNNQGQLTLEVMRMQSKLFSLGVPSISVKNKLTKIARRRRSH